MSGTGWEDVRAEVLRRIEGEAVVERRDGDGESGRVIGDECREVLQHRRTQLARVQDFQQRLAAPTAV